MFMVFQIVLLAFALLALLRTFRQYRKSEVSGYWAFLFTLLWIAVLVVTAVPHLADRVANLVGIGRGADLILYTAVIVLVSAAYRSIVREQQLSREMTELVRAVAIERAILPEEEL